MSNEKINQHYNAFVKDILEKTKEGKLSQWKMANNKVFFIEVMLEEKSHKLAIQEIPDSFESADYIFSIYESDGDTRVVSINGGEHVEWAIMAELYQEAEYWANKEVIDLMDKIRSAV